MSQRLFDPRRRQLLQRGLAGSSALLLPPWLAGCSNSTGGVLATPPPSPVPAPVPVPTPIPAAKFAPRGEHLSWTADPRTTRTCTWFTDGTAAPDTSLIEYGPVTPGMSAEQIASAPFEARMNAGTTPTPGVAAFTHKATASGLDAALPMRYRVGSVDGYSAVRVVRPTPTGSAFRFCHFGDHGYNENSRTVARAMAARQPDFALLAGDISYANGDQPLWDDYFATVTPDYAASNILMTAPGNHEEESNAGATYRNRFACPISAVSPDGTYYTFDLGRVHFVITTAGAFVADGTLGVELAFLETDLAAAAARRAAGMIDFIVVAQHFTIWTDQEGRGPAAYDLVALEENIILRYGVDLLAVGHDHIYQRSKPMAYGMENPLGYVQVTSGCGGKDIRGFEPTIQAWSAKHHAELLFVEYLVEDGLMSATTYGVHPDTGALSVVDTFELRRRDTVAANLAVQPVRPLSVFGIDIDQLARATQAKHKRLLRSHCLGLAHV